MLNLELLKKIKERINQWSLKKKETISKKKVAYFKERDIFWMRMGENVGFEQSGKGELFMRPVVIIKKFNNQCFWAIPLTTQNKVGKYYEEITLNGESRIAIISQLRFFDVHRLERKIGILSFQDFEKIKKALIKII